MRKQLSIGLNSALCCALFMMPFAFSTAPAAAQGFFESLFGALTNAPSRQRVSPYRPPLDYSPYVDGQPDPWWSARRNPYQSRRGGLYKAMCVRTCDGYYWPISDRATGGQLYDLAHQCRESCNGAATLFYLPSLSDDIGAMTDFTGRAYEDHENAFLYRKKLVKACTCKPMPWSAEARARHRSYARLEAEKEMPRRPGEADTTKPKRTIIESLDDWNGAHTERRRDHASRSDWFSNEWDSTPGDRRSAYDVEDIWASRSELQTLRRKRHWSDYEALPRPRPEPRARPGARNW